MVVSIPTHDQWKRFKKTHGVESNAVSSVNVGKALDTFHKAYGRNFQKNADAASACYKELATYLAKFPDKSHGQDTLDKVVKLCHVTAKSSMDTAKKQGLF
ncbi:hypothetical protein OEW28_00385 [Defluviimonas sp. WL0002]|uniref:Uncharacterized protein n=1 Tax=Albidovulum marisflavi TaxID=2984159 RepID=A0ABT2Z7J9_9RHOB|nr:hypothetical protein [Defluviimonas sp. WL0002]MCV2867080.1 hypothetical protein [Defluviimonas sp. WL0002]